jgi:hypothetical protein
MKSYRKNHRKKKREAKKYASQPRKDTIQNIEEAAAIGTFSWGYDSFGGVDIRAALDNNTIGTLQGITYSVSREPTPIYTMGDTDAREFARGRRTIAGSISSMELNRVFRHTTPIPPFDVILTAENNNGQRSRMNINGVELLSSSVSTNYDTNTTRIYDATYIAQSIMPWRAERGGE